MIVEDGKELNQILPKNDVSAMNGIPKISIAILAA
jgi:hypothetical protein